VKAIENQVKIIAEIGVNHNGKLDLAKQLIDEAFAAGVDIVKIQTSVPKLLTSKHAFKADYALTSTDPGESMLEMCEKLALSFEDCIVLRDHAKKIGVGFLSSPFDIPSAKFLSKLGLDCIKIPSGEINNLPYMRVIGKMNKDLIMSTGMARMSEVEDALGILVQSGTKKENITVLHCNTEYPTPFMDVNLNAMLAIKEKFQVEVGYSDHSVGIEVAIAAVALGAQIIEKHFTLDRNMEGPDHVASLEPKELKAMVKAIRNIEEAMGDGIKRASPSEEKNIAVTRKSIVAACKISKGEIFSEDNLTVKRPAIGVSPMKWDQLIGKPAQQDYDADDLIRL
jgi:N,N'-diacetyllegionaminate synthase